MISPSRPTRTVFSSIKPPSPPPGGWPFPSGLLKHRVHTFTLAHVIGMESNLSSMNFGSTTYYMGQVINSWTSTPLFIKRRK